MGGGINWANRGMIEDKPVKHCAKRGKNQSASEHPIWPNLSYLFLEREEGIIISKTPNIL
jgi:hypothetical protein